MANIEQIEVKAYKQIVKCEECEEGQLVKTQWENGNVTLHICNNCGANVGLQPYTEYVFLEAKQHEEIKQKA